MSNATYLSTKLGFTYWYSPTQLVIVWGTAKIITLFNTIL